jgi:hypothetical protein
MIYNLLVAQRSKVDELSHFDSAEASLYVTNICILLAGSGGLL